MPPKKQVTKEELTKPAKPDLKKKGKTEPKSKTKPELQPEPEPEPKPEPELKPEPEVVQKVVKKKGKQQIKVDPIPEPKENTEVVKKGKAIKPTEVVKVAKIDMSQLETEYNKTFKEWETVNYSLSNFKKEISVLEEKRNTILTQLSKLLKKIQGNDDENIVNPLEAPSNLKKEITKVVISPKDDNSSSEESSSSEDESSESIKKGIKKFTIDKKESDTDSD
jgi:hypothetical protein